ncbi:MAG: hypothetical protein M3388_18620 [Acidobacteriota bacterium]|nr:hypothetical protein [Acidobacteriota bacterium]
MKKIVGIFQRLFGVPWLVFGVQHFTYADFVAGLVPAYLPARIFWVYLTGAAMIAAGLAFIFNRKASLAAVLLGTMLLMFILLIHIPKLASVDYSAINWTRALQDLALAATALILAGVLSKQKAENNLLKNISMVSRYLLAILLIVFGVQQFMNLDFLTAKVPVYLPLRMFWVYLTGMWLIITGANVLINKKARLFAVVLGAVLLIVNLLNYVPALMSESRSALLLTAAMLDLAITCGVFILADSSPEENPLVETDAR